MLRLLQFILLCIGAALTFSWLARQEGMTIIDFAGWQIELRTSILLVAAVIALMLLIILYRSLRALILWPGWLGHNWQLRRKEKGERALGLGMVAFAAGDHKMALKQARKAEKLLGQGLLPDLLSAQAAHATGDTKAAMRYFTSLSNQEDTAYFGQVGLMRLYQGQGRHEESLFAAEQAVSLSGQSAPAHLRLLAEDLRTKNWRQALDRLDILMRQKNDVLMQTGPNEGFLSGQLSHPALLAAHLCVLLAEQEAPQRQNLLKKALSYHPHFIEGACRLAALLAETHPKQAVSQLEKDFKICAHSALADMLAKISGDNDGQLIARLGRLAEQAANQDEARLIVAEKALQRGIWASASAMLEAVSESGQTNHYFLLMAELYDEKLKLATEDEKASLAERKQTSLKRAAQAPHGPGWQCLACHSFHAKWEMICPSCEVLGQMEWGRLTVHPSLNQLEMKKPILRK